MIYYIIFLQLLPDEPTAKLVNILEHNNGIVVEPLECLVVGLAVCWEQCDAYYINLSKTENLLFSEDGEIMSISLYYNFVFYFDVNVSTCLLNNFT